jgi:nucleotide-binding universal stress UspA family protein
MSSSSPSDLAVAFRSVERRLREAFGDDVPSAEGTDGIQRAVDEAARLLHTTPQPGAVADAIDAVPADAWDVAVLDRLRELALELGAQLRRLAAAHEHEE